LATLIRRFGGRGRSSVFEKLAKVHQSGMKSKRWVIFGRFTGQDTKQTEITRKKANGGYRDCR